MTDKDIPYRDRCEPDQKHKTSDEWGNEIIRVPFYG